MPNSELIESILSKVKELGLLQSMRRLPPQESDGAYRVEGEITVEGRTVTLQLVLAPSFPLCLPRFNLCPWNALGFIPHVDPSGNICFTDKEGLVLDQDRPVEIIEASFRKTIDLLSRGVKGDNERDFIDEFGSYWLTLFDRTNAHTRSIWGTLDSESFVVNSVLGASDEIREVIIAFDRPDAAKAPTLWVGGNEGDIDAFVNGKRVAGRMHRQSGIYVPLQSGTSLLPPRPDGPFWSAEEARCKILSGLSPANQKRLNRLMRKRSRRSREYVIVSLPRPSGGVTFFGLRYDSRGTPHSLWLGRQGDHLYPLFMRRMDREYLLRRGGGSPVLEAKRVLLVGCGALGGYLAFELARAGILDLTLVDPDVLTPENWFRHVLGRQFLDELKVERLKKDIEAQLPYVRVTAVANRIERALEDGSIDLANYDLMVIALGNPTIELYLNKQVQKLPGKPMALFTWLEPFGIGGHAFLTHKGSEGGCFECLYSSRSIIGLAHNQASFAAANQSFGRTLSGCENMHTPYGSIDALRSAALASHLAIDALTDRERGNALLSWKGDASAFLNEGFILSAEYGLSEPELYAKRYAYRTNSCKICGADSSARLTLRW